LNPTLEPIGESLEQIVWLLAYLSFGLGISQFAIKVIKVVKILKIIN
jgi:hypothetical protein